MSHPLVILALGIGIVIGAILVLRVNAFIALIAAAFAVSLCAPGEVGQKIARVGIEFGTTAGKIGIVIAFAAIIGDCLTRSGAADRIVRFLMRLLGEKRAPAALMASGFVLSIPVFFDTIFYLLLPLARSTHRRTGMRYLLLILAMGAGASITHSMVPPTPGPLILADIFKIDLGAMIMLGLAVSLPTGILVYCFVAWWARKFDIPMRPLASALPEPAPLPDAQLPGLLVSVLPIILPVILISINTIASSLARVPGAGERIVDAAQITAVIGNPSLAMLFSAAIAAAVLAARRRPGRAEMSRLIESSLTSAGLIILITSAGGAFGAMLKEAQIGASIERTFFASGGGIGGMKLLLAGFLVAFVIKFAQGSSTVSMLTAGAMMAAMIGAPETLGFHPVYLALAIGWGAQCGNWMNDSGFWVFAKMGGLTEVEALKTWTVTVSLTAIVGLAMTMAFAALLPLA
ncbi:MAG TPA: gluconate permease [Planctomycetes bacterium]|nr:gluconate permease [Planctomycetota bacterium]